MIIGIDAREAAGKPAGKGRYVQEIIRHLAAGNPDLEFRLYTQQIADLGSLPNNVSWRIVKGRGLGWHWRTARLARRECDVYFSTTSYVTPQFLKVPYVLVVYDLVSFKDFAASQRRARAIERQTLSRAARRARAILTISEASAADLGAMLPEVKHKITVTPLAADPRFSIKRSRMEVAAIRTKYGLPDSFILSTGTIEPRKNLARLVRAYRELPEELRQKHGLVLVGKKGWQYQSVFAEIDAAGPEGNIKYLDFVSNQDLVGLYAAATVFCYPSLYEGFGLPVLEAMSAGLPVITSNVSSLPEVGGKAVRYADPHQADAIRAALTELLGSAKQRQELRAAGLKRAKRFSWDKTADKTAEVLRGT